MRGPTPSRSEAAGFFRLIRGLKRFISETITAEQARAAIARRMEAREQRFLEKLETVVFSRRDSPYFRLLSWAGCEPGDVRELVRKEGVEGTLERLRRAGVFVSWEEFKGWQPLRRGSQCCSIRDTDFDNPIARGHYTATSGGTSGRPLRVRVDIDELAEAAVNWAVCFDAHGWEGRPLLFWTSGHTGFANRYLRCLKFGFPYLKWFRMSRPGNRADSLRAFLLHGTLRLLTGLPKPESTPLSQAPVVLDSLLQLIDTGKKPILNTTPSAAGRLATLAGERERSLAGCTFLLGAEPVTRDRRRAIESSGAVAVPTYGTSEAGWIGARFPETGEADEISLFRDAYAVIQETSSETPADADQPILLTGLRRASPKVLLNAAIGDSAMLGRRPAPAAAPWYDVSLHTIRGLRKITLWGTSFAVSDLYPLLEQTLPRRFGGSPQSYQLVEEEGSGGLTCLRLLVGPDVKDPDEVELRRTFLAELRKLRHYYDSMIDVLAQAQALQIVRADPVRTSRDKLLPVLPLRHDRTDPGRGS